MKTTSKGEAALNRAANSLIYYFQQAGVDIDNDVAVELRGVVEDIIEAAVEAIEEVR